MRKEKTAMTRINSSKASRIIAGMIAVLMILGVLFFSFYISSELEHNCTGGDCPICASIQQCENVLHKIGGGIALAVSIILPVLLICVLIYISGNDLLQATPVSRKIRMND